MLTVIIATRNEIDHIERCLEPLYSWANQIIVVDSSSDDGSVELLKTLPIEYVNFQWDGSWPKKRQWALDNLQINNKWILLLDADEIVTDKFMSEVSEVILNPKHDGYLVPLDIIFLGNKLRYGDSRLYKLALFRKNMAGFIKRVDIDETNLDMEVHEHVALKNEKIPGKLSASIDHYSVHSIRRIIEKYNDYSDWEVKAFNNSTNSKGLGKQARFRRNIKRLFLRVPLSDIVYFLYLYVYKLGILDGKPGYHRARLQSQQLYMIKLKLAENIK